MGAASDQIRGQGAVRGQREQQGPDWGGALEAGWWQ